MTCVKKIKAENQKGGHEMAVMMTKLLIITI